MQVSIIPVWEKKNLRYTSCNASRKESSKTDETEKLFEEQLDSMAKTTQNFKIWLQDAMQDSYSL